MNNKRKINDAEQLVDVAVVWHNAEIIQLIFNDDIIWSIFDDTIHGDMAKLKKTTVKLGVLESIAYSGILLNGLQVSSMKLLHKLLENRIKEFENKIQTLKNEFETKLKLIKMDQAVREALREAELMNQLKKYDVDYDSNDDFNLDDFNLDDFDPDDFDDTINECKNCTGLRNSCAGCPDVDPDDSDNKICDGSCDKCPFDADNQINDIDEINDLDQINDIGLASDDDILQR